MIDWLILVGGTITALFPIANPFSTAPVFATLTSTYSKKDRNLEAKLAATYMAIVLIIVLLIGAFVLKFFAIGLPSLRIAGGLLIARVGFSMVSGKSQDSAPENDDNETKVKKSIAFSPLAMPLLSGPGSMAVVLSMATVSESIGDFTGVGMGILIVAFISWLVLRSSSTIAERLGVTGMNALTSVMGFLLVCIGIRFISTGFIEGISDPNVMGIIVDSVQKALGN